MTMETEIPSPGLEASTMIAILDAALRKVAVLIIGAPPNHLVESNVLL